ncbi:MAG: methyltransferase domain-containing protein [Sedimentisphaerales bacterium]
MTYRLFENIRKRRASGRTDAKIREYLKSGCKPYTSGYKEYKKTILCSVLADQELLACFRYNKTLPANYGFRIDERVVEYPWVLARLGVAEGLLLDAGSALNHEYLLDHPTLRNKKIVIYNLSPEKFLGRSNVSYIFGDLRHTILRNESFDEIVCISTLEHIGMNNTLLYSKDACFNEFKPNDHLDVVREFKRLLKPGGRFFATVPYGRHENHGWLQQFDCKMIDAVCDTFRPSSHSTAYYKYFPDGWQITRAEECTDCSYFDIHNKSDYEPDYAAAARSVACIELIK